MTFTYSNDPSTSQRNAIRFNIQDTDSTDPLFSDEEINYNITEWGPNTYEICRVLCEVLGSKFNRLAESTSKSIGDISVSNSYADRSTKYQELARSFLNRRLRKSRPTIGFEPEAMKSTADRVVTTQNSDFYMGAMDNGSAAPSSGD